MVTQICFILLAAVVVTNAYIVIDTYPDANCNTTAIARYISNEACIVKRSAAQNAMCDSSSIPGVHFIADSSYCSATIEPTFADGWQFIKLSGDVNCNFTASTYVAFGAPQSLDNTLIAISTALGYVAANVSLSCNNGVMSHAACIPQKITYCYDFNTIQNNVCTSNSQNNSYALQTSCSALPVAAPMMNQPMNAPWTTPLSATPVKTPLRAPVKAPTSKTSSASIVVGSLAFLSAAILM